MALSDAQKDLLRESWTLIEAEDLVKVGLSMYFKLFSDNPDLIPMFRFTGGKPLSELMVSPRLKVHAKNVMKTVGGAVSLLDDTPALTTTLSQLGDKHKKYGTLPHQFPMVGSAMMHAFATALGDKFTPEVEQTWVALFKTVTDIMAAALVA